MIESGERYNENALDFSQEKRELQPHLDSGSAPLQLSFYCTGTVADTIHRSLQSNRSPLSSCLTRRAVAQLCLSLRSWELSWRFAGEWLLEEASI